MPYTIKPKRSAIAGISPTTANLVEGEIAMNTSDGALFTRNSVGVTRFGVVEGTPEENQVGRYDGTKFVPSLLEVSEEGYVAGDGRNLTNVNALVVNSTGVVVLTAAAYSSLTPVATTLYFII
jgi:hypothetical protein